MLNRYWARDFAVAPFFWVFRCSAGQLFASRSLVTRPVVAGLALAVGFVKKRKKRGVRVCERGARAG